MVTESRFVPGIKILGAINDSKTLGDDENVLWLDCHFGCMDIDVHQNS
jgi:hypothetical protein